MNNILQHLQISCRWRHQMSDRQWALTIIFINVFIFSLCVQWQVTQLIRISFIKSSNCLFGSLEFLFFRTLSLSLHLFLLISLSISVSLLHFTKIRGREVERKVSFAFLRLLLASEGGDIFQCVAATFSTISNSIHLTKTLDSTRYPV